MKTIIAVNFKKTLEVKLLCSYYHKRWYMWIKKKSSGVFDVCIRYSHPENNSIKLGKKCI